MQGQQYHQLSNKQHHLSQQTSAPKQQPNKRKILANDKENSSQQENNIKAKQSKSSEKNQNTNNGRSKQQSDIFDQQQFQALKKQAFTYQPQVIDSQNDQSHSNFVHVPNSGSFQGGFSQHFQHIAQLSNENNIFSNTQIINNETLDSIKGRRVDSPQLLVVREIKELDEEDDVVQDDQMRQFGTGSDDFANLLWNSRDLRQQHFTNESPAKNAKKKQHTKSVDNKHNKQNKNNSQAKMRAYQKEHNAQRYHHNLQNHGTKSQREIRSSMGFNELLNHLDKDVSINQTSNLNDFKNRTTFDLLKLELSGIRRQTSQSKSKANKVTRSKSRDNKRKGGDIRADKDDPSVRNYNEAHSQQFADKTKPQSTLGGSGSVPVFQQLASRSKASYPQSVQNQILKLVKEQKASCAQGESPHKKEFKAIGSIDKLIKNNIKRMKEKENGAKLLKQKSEEMLKKKKVDLDQKNSQVRKTNQERTLRRKNQFQNSGDPSQTMYYQVRSDAQNNVSGAPKRFKSDQIHFVNQQSHVQPHKQAQTQKIDFDEIKEEYAGRKGDKKSSIKNHRKSYGLEFFEIKKEIEQELRTIDQKIKPGNNSLLLKPKPKLNFLTKNNNNNIDQSIKPIQVKLGNRHEVIEKKSSTERTPITKVVIVKKDKIRRFMKAKKKELITIAMHQKREEISRFIKMQQNMHKLNDFCKKKLDKISQQHHKQQVLQSKKRNVTMQAQDQQYDEQDKKEYSKISIKTKNTTAKRNPNFHQNHHVQNQNDNSNNNIMLNTQHDSSKISTEFYEEYFRLLNSISKEQKENVQQVSGQTHTGDQPQSSNKKVKRRLLKSPLNRSSSPNKSGAAMGSPSNVENHSRLVLTKIAKKSKSKSNLKQAQSQANKISLKPPVNQRKPSKEHYPISQEPKNVYSSLGNSRAESAPLFFQQSSIKKKKNASLHKQSQRGGGTALTNEGATISDISDRNRELSNSERLHMLLYNIVFIQRAFRAHLNAIGFYQHKSSQQPNGYQSSFYNGDTVVMQQVIESIDKINQGENDSDDMSDNSDENNNQMLIINQQDADQEKKVIYMSNINSCSAPQSPKDDSQKTTINQELIKCVFNYDMPNLASHQQFSSSHQSSIDEIIHQEVSQKPSVRTIEIDTDNQAEAPNMEELKEMKPSVDYNMRMFTGSQSLLNELKQATPKSNSHLVSQDQFILSQRSHASKRNNSNENVASLQLPQQQQFSIDSKHSYAKDHTSQSSQSLFDRNSFQQFTKNKLTQIEQNNEFANLIDVREKALEYRQKKETKFMKRLYKNKQLSPRTYSMKKQQLEKWVHLEQEEIKKTKIAFNEEWKKTVQMIEDTQKNVEQMRERMKLNVDSESLNKYHQGLFNSQSSRNSNSSYVPSAKRRSILEDELKLSQRSLVQSTMNQDDKKSHNLIEYLEHRWQSQKQDDGEDKNKLQSKKSRQGIYIEDQNEQIQSPSQLSPENDQNDNEVFFEKQLQQINKASLEDLAEDEKTLQRSRSEQDLSELIKKSKVSYQESEEAVNDHNLLETQHIESMSQTIKDLTVRKTEIQIEENQFESQDQVQLQPEKYQDLQSNDSILNESELNMYFQEQQFSLEDFKSLDKKKILDQQQTSQEDSYEEIIQLDRYNEEAIEAERLLKKQPKENNYILEKEQHQQEQFPTSSKEDNIKAAQNTSHVVVMTEPNECQQYFDDKLLDINPHLRAYTPEIEQNNNGMFQQQYLFSDAKPGQNIKIADILRKSQTFNNGPESINSYTGEQSSTNSQQQQLMFQNHQIHQYVQVLPPSNAQLAITIQDQNNNNILADQITDELIRQIIQQSLVIPQRISALQGYDDQTEQVITGHQVAQDQNQDVFIIDSLINEKESKREIIEFKQRALVEQDLQRAEIYINEVISVLLQSEIAALENEGQSDFQDFHKQFLNTLTAPIKRNEIEILNQLQTAEIGSYEHFETVIQPNQYPILPVELYLEIERQREEQQMQYLMNGGTENAANLGNSVLQESVHIHNKAIFDALNESLIKFRPYGLQGEPMPWSNRNRRLQTKVDAGSVDTERLFMMVKQDVLRWIQTYSGCQASPVFVFPNRQNNNVIQNNQIVQMSPAGEQEVFDEELFQETRERRLAATLANEVVESEHLWLNYEFEDNQVKIDLSDMILEHLVEEIVVVLNGKANGQSQNNLQS